MALVGDLFFAAGDETCLDWRIRPTDDQFDAQKERWNDLKDALVEALREKSGCGISSWLQGSYKFGTQIRPAGVGQEFDIDLGIYYRWNGKPDDGGWSPLDLKNMVQEVLIEYAEDENNDAEGVSAPKPRCARIHFKDDFHIDVPAYHLDPNRDARALATEANEWEDSDPKAIYIWWKNVLDEVARAKARRVVRYLKMWALLKFHKTQGPSSILITVLVADALQKIDLNEYGDDEDLFFAVIQTIVARLTGSSIVLNPVNANENLNRLTGDDLERFLTNLTTLASTGARAVAAQTRVKAAEIWAEVFEHFIVVPEEDPEELALLGKAMLPIPVFVPNVHVAARPLSGRLRVWEGVNQLPPIPKGCEIEYSLINAAELPAGSTVHWTVRNTGDEAERENDLGHLAGDALSVKRNSAYKGEHFMDLTVRQNGAVIGRRRINVHVTGIGMPLRNPKTRPSYIKFR